MAPARPPPLILRSAFDLFARNSFLPFFWILINQQVRGGAGLVQRSPLRAAGRCYYRPVRPVCIAASSAARVRGFLPLLPSPALLPLPVSPQAYPCLAAPDKYVFTSFIDLLRTDCPLQMRTIYIYMAAQRRRSLLPARPAGRRAAMMMR